MGYWSLVTLNVSSSSETVKSVDLGRDGGVVIGTHSISPEIPLENYLIYRDVCLGYWPEPAG